MNCSCCRKERKIGRQGRRIVQACMSLVESLVKKDCLLDQFAAKKKKARVPEAIISLAYSPVAHCLRCRSGIIISRCLQYICAVIKRRVGRPHTVAIMLHDSSLIYTFSAKVDSRYGNHFVMAGAYGRLVHMVYILNHHRPYQI